MQHRSDGFFRSLFDGSFAPYIATGRVKVLYALWLIATTFLCVVVTLAGFGRSAAADAVTLAVVAPLLFLVSLVAGRIFIKVILAVLGQVRGPLPVPAEARVGSHTPVAR